MGLNLKTIFLIGKSDLIRGRVATEAPMGEPLRKGTEPRATLAAA